MGAGQRTRLSLDGAWGFRHESGVTGTALVPGPWQAQFPALRQAMGRATYARDLDLPGVQPGQIAVLCFGAASDSAVVRLDGQVIGQHEGGWLPFEVILPEGLAAGPHRLEVECHLPDGSEGFAEIPHGKQSWYGPIGGLWQSVTLELRPIRHLTRCAIRASMAGEVDLQLWATAGGSAALEVLDAAGQIVATADVDLSAQGGARSTLRVSAPRLWSPDDPALYALRVRLGEDCTSHSFGFREFAARNGKFFLNGKPFYMRAALDQDYYPATICTPPSLEFLEDQARKAKMLGLNMLRCHIKVPDPRYYEVADRLGLLIWTEIPNVALLTEASARRLTQTMEGILARDGNHPSIVIWTLINEDWGTRLAEDAAHRAWLARTYDWLKKLDPTRLVVDNSPCHGNFHVKTDIDDYHYYRSIPERRAEWDALTAEFAARPAWSFSPHGDGQRRGDEPLVVSEFGVWGLPDPEAVRLDGAEPWWMGTGASWGDGAAYPHGVQDRFAELQLHKTFGSFDAFIGAAQAYQFANLKYEIESIRSHAAIQGYVITEFTDVHWESNGLLDMNRNPRRFAADFAKVNAEVVLVPELARHAGWSGESLPVGIAISSGAQALPEGMIDWQAEGASGQIAVPPIAALEVWRGDGLTLPLPATGDNRMVDLVLRYSAGRQVRAESVVPVALYHPREQAYPKVAAPEELHPWLTALGVPIVGADEAEVHLAQVLGPTDIARLQLGAKYLVLADGSNGSALRSDQPRREPPDLIWTDGAAGLPGPREGLLPNMGLVARHGTLWRGDWIAGFSWIRRDGPFADLPGGPLLDITFDRVVPHHVLTGFRTWEFGGPVQGGVVVGWVHKPAALVAERSVGLGRATVSTFRLFNDPPGRDPVAATLLSAMLRAAWGPGGD